MTATEIKQKSLISKAFRKKSNLQIYFNTEKEENQMYKNELQSLSDSELMLLLQIAREKRSKQIKAIYEELNRRNREE